MGLADQEPSRPFRGGPTRAGRRPFLSIRSVILTSASLAIRAAIILISLTQPLSQNLGAIATLNIVSAVVAIAALTSVLTDARSQIDAAERRGADEGYLRAWNEMFDNLFTRIRPSRSGNVVDLAVARRNHAPGRWSAPTRPTVVLNRTELADARPAPRRAWLLLVLVPLLLLLVGVGAWQALTASTASPPPVAISPPTSAPLVIGVTPSASTGSQSTNTPPTSKAPTQPAARSSSPVAVAAPPESTPDSPMATPSTDPIADGTYLVGTDIAAGTWSTGALVNVNLDCQYKLNGRTVPVVLSVGPASVALHRGDRFTTSGCDSWHWVST